MKAQPILFSAPMVRAILEGRKTQTRRILKPQPRSMEYWLRGSKSDRLRGLPTMRDETGQGWAACGPFRCPYVAEAMYAGEGGRLGSRRIGDTTERKSLLWVKETFRFGSDLDPKSPSAIADSAIDAGYRCAWAPTKYEADGATANEETLQDFGGGWGKTRVSIHMPRWASRITLEVTSVRVERVQDISEEDAIAEGVFRFTGNSLAGWPEVECLDGRTFFYHPETIAARVEFNTLWDSINAERGYGWDENPWVWVVEFERVESEVCP